LQADEKKDERQKLYQLKKDDSGAAFEVFRSIPWKPRSAALKTRI